MTAWGLPALIIIVLVSSIALIHRRESVADICKLVRKTAIRMLIFSAVCLIGVVVLSSAFTYTSEYLSSVLSVEFMTDVREMLKALFGTESVFTSLQLLGACCLFMFSFASCAFCICGVCIMLLRTATQKENGVEELKEKCVDLSGVVCVRRFALLSRYLL